MIGESPTRPGILKKRPDVVVTPARSPLAVTQSQLIVPCGRKSSSPRGFHGLLALPDLRVRALGE